MGKIKLILNWEDPLYRRAIELANFLYWSPDFSRNWDLRIHPRACVRPSVRVSVRKILNDYPLYFSENLHGVTTLYGGMKHSRIFENSSRCVPRGSFTDKKAQKCPKMAKK